MDHPSPQPVRSLTTRLPLRLIAAYWRLKRGATLGAQGVVIDGEERVLLVRHSYREGWHFPGGGVEWRETAEAALAREIEEETGVVVTGRPALHGLFANVASLPSDHIALFVVRDWRRPRIPPPNREIRESKFFARSELPAGLNGGARRRFAEIFEGAKIDPHW